MNEVFSFVLESAKENRLPSSIFSRFHVGLWTANQLTFYSITISSPVVGGKWHHIATHDNWIDCSINKLAVSGKYTHAIKQRGIKHVISILPFDAYIHIHMCRISNWNCIICRRFPCINFKPIIMFNYVTNSLFFKFNSTREWHFAPAVYFFFVHFVRIND